MIYEKVENSKDKVAQNLERKDDKIDASQLFAITFHCLDFKVECEMYTLQQVCQKDDTQKHIGHHGWSFLGFSILFEHRELQESRKPKKKDDMKEIWAQKCVIKEFKFELFKEVASSSWLHYIILFIALLKLPGGLILTTFEGIEKDK